MSGLCISVHSTRRNCNLESAVGKELHEKRLQWALLGPPAPQLGAAFQLRHSALVAAWVMVLLVRITYWPGSVGSASYLSAKPSSPACTQASLYKILKSIHQSCLIKTYRQVSMTTVYKTTIEDTSSHASIRRSLLHSGLFKPVTSIFIISKRKKKITGKVVGANILQDKIACVEE